MGPVKRCDEILRLCDEALRESAVVYGGIRQDSIRQDSIRQDSISQGSIRQNSMRQGSRRRAIT